MKRKQELIEKCANPFSTLPNEDLHKHIFYMLIGELDSYYGSVIGRSKEFEKFHALCTSLKILNSVSKKWSTIISRSRQYNQLLFLSTKTKSSFEISFDDNSKTSLTLHNDDGNPESIPQALTPSEKNAFTEVRLCCYKINQWLPRVNNILTDMEKNNPNRKIRVSRISIGNCGGGHEWEWEWNRDEDNYNGSRLQASQQIGRFYSLIKSMSVSRFDLAEPMYCKDCHVVDFECQELRGGMYHDHVLIQSDPNIPINTMTCKCCPRSIDMDSYCDVCFCKSFDYCSCWRENGFVYQYWCGAIVCRQCLMEKSCATCNKWWSPDCAANEVNSHTRTKPRTIHGCRGKVKDLEERICSLTTSKKASPDKMKFDDKRMYEAGEKHPVLLCNYSSHGDHPFA